MTTQQLRFGDPLFYRASRERKEYDPVAGDVVGMVYRQMGKKCLVWKQECAHAKVILAAGFTVEQVMGCLAYVLSDPYWQDKDVTVGVIRKKIAGWVQRGSPARATGQSKSEAYFAKWEAKKGPIRR